MRYTLAFQQFDPKAGPLPDKLEVRFGDVARRARRLLKGRSDDEIRSALNPVAQMLRQGDSLLQERAIEMLDSGKTEVFYNSDAKALERYASRVGSLPEDGLPQGKWDEYLAVLALMHVGEAVNTLRFPCPSTSRDAVGEAEWADYLKGILEDLAREAIDAVGRAEALSTQRRAEEKQRAQRTRQAREAGRARHARTTQLIAEAVAFYREGNFKTVDSAVWSVLAQLPPKRTEKLSQNNLPKTLREGISAVLRGKRKLYTREQSLPASNADASDQRSSNTSNTDSDFPRQ
jgi:hypothetical protein